MEAGSVELDLVLTGVKKAQSELNALSRQVTEAAAKANNVTARPKIEYNNAAAQQFKRDIEQSKTLLGKLQVEARKAGEVGGKAFEQIAAASNRAVKSIQGAVFSIKGGFAAIGAGLVLKGAVADVLELERAQASLNMTLGQQGAAAFGFAKRAALEYGLSVTDTVTNFAKFTAAASQANIAMEDQQELFEQLAKASIAFGLTQAQSNRVLVAVQQIAAKGVVSMEELRQQLGEQMPIATAALAKGLGLTIPEMIKLISKGEVLAKDALPALAEGLDSFTQNLEKTTTVQLQKAINSFKELEQQLVVGLLPALGQAAEFTSAIFEGLSLAVDSTNIKGGGFFNKLLSLLPGIEDESLQAAKGLREIKKALDDIGIGVSMEELFAAQNLAMDITGQGANADATQKLLFDILIEYTKEQAKSNALAAEAEEIEKKRAEALRRQAELIKKQADDLVRQLKVENQIQAIRDKTGQKQVSQLVGSDAGNAFGAVAELNAAIAAEKLAQAELRAILADTSAKPGAVNNARDAMTVQAEKVKSLFTEASLTVQKAFENAEKSAKNASQQLMQAAVKYGSILADSDKGLSQFQGGIFKQQREKMGRDTILKEALKSRRTGIQEVKETQGIQAAEAFAQRNSVAKLQRAPTEFLQKFIIAVNTEVQARDRLKESNKKLAQAQNNLAGVTKIAADNGIAISNSQETLATSITDLASKDWSVIVNVQSGTASGDVAEIKNALS